MEDIILVSLTVIGLLFVYRSRQRRFRRTNQFGVEVFKSYFSKLTSRLFDETLLGLGLFLLSFGSLVLALKYAGDMFWLCVLIIAAFAIRELIYSDRRKMNHVKLIK